MSQRAVGLWFAVITGLCWAVLAIGLRQALPHATTGTIVWFRLIVAFLILLAYYAVTAPRTLPTLMRPGWPIVIAGLGLAINYWTYLKGLSLTSASNAQIMIQMGPLLLLIAGVVYFRESLRRQQKLGLALAGSGFALFFWDQILVSVREADRYIAGNLWIVLASVSWALFAIIQKRARLNWAPQQINLVIYGICSLALWPIATPSEMLSWSPGVWALMLALALNTVLAYGSFAEALRRAPASEVSVIISANPLLTIFLVTVLSTFSVSWIIPEPIYWRGFLGAACVVSGVILTVWKKKSAASSNS